MKKSGTSAPIISLHHHRTLVICLLIAASLMQCCNSSPTQNNLKFSREIKAARNRDTNYLNSNDLSSSSSTSSVLSDNTPRILTKYVYITSYEHYTVILPCEILNLPSDMHVIWQYGKRGETNQTVITVGGTQIETNYRVRVITNSSDDDRHLYESIFQTNNEESNNDKPKARITTHNLEIRKLQLSDSGWYECQLPTKPTQINYVFLEVLALPKIETNTKLIRAGDTIELVCQVKNLPKRFDLHWLFNEKRINATVLRPLNEVDYVSSRVIKHSIAGNKPAFLQQQLFINNNQISNYKNKYRIGNSGGMLHVVNRRNVNSTRKQPQHHHSDHSYSITYDRISNTTICRLRIKDIDEHHKGVYKCKYDKVETKYNLEFKNFLKTRVQLYDQYYSGSNSANTIIKQNNSEFLLAQLFSILLFILLNSKLVKFL